MCMFLFYISCVHIYMYFPKLNFYTVICAIASFLTLLYGGYVVLLLQDHNNVNFVFTENFFSSKKCFTDLGMSGT